MTRAHSWQIALAASTAISTIAGAGWAQTSPAPPPSDTAAPASAQPSATPATSAPTPDSADQKGKPKAALEEIVVTADRKNSFSADYVQAGSFRGARNLDTPLTVSVINNQILQSQQAIDLIDALRNTAGVSSNSTGPVAYNNVSIRGVTLDTRANFRLDGSLPIISSIAFPLEDKDRVEVLKGASALYYGFSNPSGIVNLTMKRPTSSPYLNATAFGDDNGGVGGDIDASDSWVGPWGKFGARINTLYADEDYGIQFANGHRYLLSGAFDYQPIERLKFQFDVENFEKNVVEPGIFKLVAPKATAANPFPTLVLPQLTDPSHNFGPSWANNDAKETNVLSKASYKISDAWNFSTDFGYSTLNRARFQPQFTPGANVASGAGTLIITPQDAVFTTVYYRAQVDGTFYTGPFLHEVIFGASRSIRDAGTPVNTKLNFANNYLDPINIAPVAQIPFSAKTTATTRIDDEGFYAFDRVKITDWLQVLGGLRQSHYTESTQTTGKDTFGPDTPLSYSYGGILKPMPWASIYGTYIQGLETTTPAPLTAINASAQLGPTMSNQKEIGLKLEPKRGLIFQFAWFDILRGSTYVNAANLYVLDGQAEYEGEEVSLSGELTRDLSVYASATSLSAKQVSGAPTETTGGVFTPSIVGKRIEGTPDVTVSVAGEYKLPFYRDVSLTAGVYYTSNQAVNANNNAFIPSYTTYDLGASYQHDIAGHHTVFRVNGQNITNKAYFGTTAELFLSQGLPQTVKFSISTTY